LSGLTKIFIVLQLVFSVAISVLLVLMVSHQENYKGMVDSATSSSVALRATVAHDQETISALNASLADKDRQNQSSQAQSQQQLADLTTKNASLQQQVASLTASNAQVQTNLASLTATVTTQQEIIKQQSSELTNLRPQVAELTLKNADLNRANNDATNQNRAAEQAIRRLQEQIATAPTTGSGAAAPTEGGQVARFSASSQTPVQINGTVSDLDQAAGRTLIETKLGARDGVRVNTRFAIFRDNKYVGDAVVERVLPGESVAVVVSTKPGESVQKGDIVQSGQ
jgi:chromosome segregation ATPase